MVVRARLAVAAAAAEAKEAQAGVVSSPHGAQVDELGEAPAAADTGGDRSMRRLRRRARKGDARGVCATETRMLHVSETMSPVTKGDAKAARSAFTLTVTPDEHDRALSVAAPAVSWAELPSMLAAPK